MLVAQLNSVPDRSYVDFSIFSLVGQATSYPFATLAGASQNPQRPFLHLLGLRGGLIKAQPEVGPSVFPGHLDGGFHVVRQDYKLRPSPVIISAEAHDVDLSHSGRKIAEKAGGEQEGR